MPLFIEKLTKTIVESGIVTEPGDHCTMMDPVTPLAIPTSLQASLIARLDRLAPTREIAQSGVALDREFTHPLIIAVALTPQQRGDALEHDPCADPVARSTSPQSAQFYPRAPDKVSRECWHE